MTVEEVLNTKTYVKENSGVSFASPKSYIEPFIEKVDRIPGIQWQVQTSDRNANKDEDGTLNEAFGRVLIQAKLPDAYNIDEHDSVIGMVYALDIGKPLIKVYSGREAWACTNLCIFNAEHVYTQDLIQGTGTVYNKAGQYADKVEEAIEEFHQIYGGMKETTYQGMEQIDEIIGRIVRNGMATKAVGITPVTAAVRELTDPKSIYAIKNDMTTQWNMYSAITQYITDKTDIIDKATKTILIKGLFDN